MSTAQRNGAVDYFTILGLSKPQHKYDNTLTSDVLRAAYRRTLLIHHPDKVEDHQRPTCISYKADSSAERAYTIDQIIEAYQTLADPSRRAEYQEKLLRVQHLTNGRSAKQLASSGLEVIDLEDLILHEGPDGRYWCKECRCGNSYMVHEQQLEEVFGSDSIVVQCQGCSICVAITFEAVEEQH